MHDALRAGAALFAAGHHRAAHDVWDDGRDEEVADERDERLLAGLGGYAMAVHFARSRDWADATARAERARSTLEALPASHRGVNVGAVRNALAALAADPERVEREAPTAVTVEETVPSLADPDFEATLRAAPALAEALGYDVDIEQAVEYARRDAAEGGSSEFVRFVVDFVREDDHRGVIARRLDQHVERRVQREEDVAGLFDSE